MAKNYTFFSPWTQSRNFISSFLCMFFPCPSCPVPQALSDTGEIARACVRFEVTGHKERATNKAMWRCFDLLVDI